MVFFICHFFTSDNESGRQKWQGVLRFLEICTTSSSATLQETGMMLIELVFFVNFFIFILFILL